MEEMKTEATKRSERSAFSISSIKKEIFRINNELRDMQRRIEYVEQKIKGLSVRQPTFWEKFKNFINS